MFLASHAEVLTYMIGVACLWSPMSEARLDPAPPIFIL